MYSSPQQPYPSAQPYSGGVFVKFDMKPVKDEEASAAAGQPVFVDREYIRIMVPGDQTSQVHRPVRPEDKVNHRAAYEDWKRGVEQRPPGVPLTEWPGLAPSQVETLRHANVYTVEQLAEVSDQNMSKLGMGYPSLRQRARDYLATAQGLAPLDDLRRKHEELQSHYAMQARQLEEMRREVEALKAEPKNRRQKSE